MRTTRLNNIRFLFLTTASALLLAAAPALQAQTNFAPNSLATVVQSGVVEWNFWGPTLTPNPANSFATLYPVAYGDGSYPPGTATYGAASISTLTNVLYGPVNTGVNYFVDQFIGEFIPPVTTNYVFFICSDDFSQLFLGTDMAALDARLICQQNSYSNPDDWTVNDGGGSVPQKRSDQFIAPGATLPQYPTGIPLVAGHMYFIELVHVQGTGGLNDAVTYEFFNAPDPANGSLTIIASTNLAFVAQPPSYVTFTRQPTNLTVIAGAEAALGVAIASDATPYIPTYQWQKNGVNITNADGTRASGPLYNIIVTANDSGATYDCVVGFLGLTNTYTSATATLTVTNGVTTVGGLKREYWSNEALGGALTQTLANSEIIGGLLAGNVPAPDYIALIPSFECPQNDGINYYAQRVSGFFIPPITTNYVFFINSDDQSDLFLSTNSAASNKVLIAQETVWSNPDQWLVSGGGSSLSQLRSDQFIPPGGSSAPFATGIPLIAGQMYYIEGDHNQGTGGDNFAVTYKYFNSADPTNGAPSALTNGVIAYSTSPGPFTLSVSSQPVSTILYAGLAASFQFGVTSSSEFRPYYQWTQYGTNIVGATASAYSFTTAVAQSGTPFQCVATVPNGTSSVTSSVVTLTVIAAPATNTYAAAVLSNSPIAYYRFSETTGATAYDYAGGHNGTYQSNSVLGKPGVPNPPFLGFETNRLSVATTKSTSNSWVLAPFGSLGALENVTLTCWIYPVGAQNSSLGLIFDRGGQVGGLDYNGSTTLGYTWNNNSSLTYGFNSGLLIPTNQWSFCALSIAPTGATLYLFNTNSLGMATNLIAHNPLTNGNSWRIGDDGSSDPGRAFNGMIDDVAIFPSALSGAQITTLYSAAGVSLPPSVPTSPISHILYPGGSVSFYGIPAGTPPIGLQWQHNGVNLINSSRISGVQTTNITITGIVASDAGSYTLVATNSVGTGSATAILTVLPAPAATSYPGTVMANNPIGYYRLNETSGTIAYDYAAGNDGTYLLGTLGQPGVQSPPYLGFESNNLSVGITNIPGGRQVLTPFGTLAGPNGLTLPNLTFTCWLYPIGTQDANCGIILDRGNGAGLNMDGTAHLGMLGYTWNNNNGNTYNFVSGLTPPPNQWSLAALSISPTQAVIYLYNTNAQLSATNVITHSETAGNIANNWDLGNDGGTVARTFNGMIDEVAVFTNVLTEQQIFNLYAAADTAGTVAFPPVVDQPPGSHVLYAGGTAAFYAGVTGSLPLTYHWQKNGVNLTDGGRTSGSQTSELTITSVAASDSGSYTLTVANSAGSTNTATATLTVLPLPATNSLAGVVLADHAIAYYPLNEASGTTAFDSIGGNDGTYQVNSLIAQPGVPNPPNIGFPVNDLSVETSSAIANAWVLAPFGNLGAFSNVTLTAWIYPVGGAQSSACGIVFDRTGAVGGLDYYNAQTLGYTWNGLSTTYGFNSGLTVPTNQWSMVALTISPTQAVLYLNSTNGQFAATNAIAHTPMATDSQWHLGNDFNSDPGRTFNGMIDSVAVFTSTLTPAQIIALYGAGVNAGVLPANIAVQPLPTVVLAGRTAEFSVVAGGGGNLTYQWSFNGNSISGATNATLIIPHAQSANVGSYSVAIANQEGSVISSNATLNVVTTAGSAAYVVAVSNLNPTAYWRFNEAAGAAYAYDYFGGYTATYGSGVYTGVANAPGPNPPTYPGFESANASFEAFNYTAASYVTVPPLNLNTNNMTILAWVWPSGAQAANTGVVVCDALGTDAGIAYEGSDQMGFIWNGTTYATGLNVTESAWSLVALVIQPNQATLYAYNPYNTYLNSGSPNAIATLNQTPGFVPQTFSANTEFGNDASDATGARTFNGFIDEVAIFNYPLTPGQVAGLYTAASGQLVAPQIALLTAPEAGQIGQTLNFSVQATGTGLSYQWQFNGNNIAGATNSSLIISNASAANIGTYSVNVSNGSGTVSSTPSVLGVLVPPSAYANLIISMGPLAYYRLDETNGTSAFDWVGPLTGTYESAAILGEPGPSNPPFVGFEAKNTSAGMTPAANSYVLAPFGNLGVPNVSFSCWIYPIGAQQAWAGLIVSRNNGTTGALATGQYQGGVNYNGAQMVGYTWNQNNANTYNFATGLIPPTNQWSLVVATIQPTAGTVYLYNAQGQASATNVIAHTSDAFGNGWRIGDDDSGGDTSTTREYNGYIGEVAIFPYTLTLAQVNAMYETALTGSAAPPPQPIISIQLSGKNVILSWTPAAGILYSSPVIGPNAVWTLVGTNNPATIPITGTEQFFQIGP